MYLPLWGMLCSIPYNLICVWAMLRMEPIRRPRLFFLLWQLLCLPIFLIQGDSSVGWMRTVLSSALWMTLVVLLAEKRGLRVMFAAILISLLSVVAEVVTSMLTVLLLGRYVDTALVLHEPKIMLAGQVAFWNIFALLCWILVRVWKRSVHSQEEAYLWRFALVPVSQHLLVMFSAVFALLRHSPPRSYLLLGVMALCCVLVDLLLFRGLRQYTAQQLARQRTQLLAQQISQQMTYYQDVVERIEETARLRHDLRNQLQTVYVLMERGEYERARDMLTAFALPLTAEEDV